MTQEERQRIWEGIMRVSMKEYKYPLYNYAEIKIGEFKDSFYYSSGVCLPLSYSGGPYKIWSPFKTVEEALAAGREYVIKILKSKIDYALRCLKVGNDYYMVDAKVGKKLLELIDQDNQLALF